MHDRASLPRFDAFWRTEIEATKRSIVVSFNKAAVCEISISSGLLTSRCGGGWWSGLDGAEASREVSVAALWSL